MSGFKFELRVHQILLCSSVASYILYFIFTNWRHHSSLHVNPHALTKFGHPIISLALRSRKINRYLPRHAHLPGVSTNNIATGMVCGCRQIRFRSLKIRFHPTLARNVFFSCHLPSKGLDRTHPLFPALLTKHCCAAIR
jgi:hypothetical protein